MERTDWICGSSVFKLFTIQGKYPTENQGNDTCSNSMGQGSLNVGREMSILF